MKLVITVDISLKKGTAAGLRTVKIVPTEPELVFMAQIPPKFPFTEAIL
jgi:hypothetical protein